MLVPAGRAMLKVHVHIGGACQLRLSGKEWAIVLDEAVVERFESRLRGELLRPADAEYEEARKAYNAMIDKHPRMIVRCADVADVMSCVNFARENDMILAVRAGGHSVAGFGLVADGLVIDLSRMRGV